MAETKLTPDEIRAAVQRLLEEPYDRDDIAQARDILIVCQAMLAVLPAAERWRFVRDAALRQPVFRNPYGQPVYGVMWECPRETDGETLDLVIDQARERDSSGQTMWDVSAEIIAKRRAMRQAEVHRG